MITLDKNGYIKRGTLVRNHTPTMAFIHMLVFAFQTQKPKRWNTNFTIDTKKKVVERFNLVRIPLGLSTMYKMDDILAAPESFIQARKQAFKLYKLGIRI